MQTLGCGIERITNIDKDEPSSKLVYTFPGSYCGVPTIVGHYLIQSVPLLRGLIAMDITDGMKPVEVSRLKLPNNFNPHWTSWDEKTQRLVVTGMELRILMLKLDQATGALSLDKDFHDANGKPGFDMADRDWPHGWKDSGLPHGMVFSR